MDEYKRIQGEYLNGVTAMPTEDIERFLTLNIGDIDAPYREERIKSLTNELNRRQSAIDAESAWETEWKAAAHEYIALTERWLSLGATWRNTEALTKWEYEGTEFYRVWSRTLITENIVEARKADIKLTMITMEKLNQADIWLIDEITQLLREEYDLSIETAKECINNSNLIPMIIANPLFVHHEDPISWVRIIAKHNNRKGVNE